MAVGRLKRYTDADKGFGYKELDTYLLLLCEDGTHGLDLSFVTHLFLVHRIGDPALISQVVSRAHRMGCDPNHGVTVQTLHLFEDAVS